MVDLILSLALTLPAQASPPLHEARSEAPQPPAHPNVRRPAENHRGAAAQRPADPGARRRAELQVTLDRRRAKSAARAAATRRARAEEAELYKAQLEYQARIAPFVVQQQQRAADLNARAESEQAWLAIARERNLIYAYGFGVPVTSGPGGVQVYGGLPGNALGRP